MNKQTTDQGIDYGLGCANVDLKTGIRYGVISQNSLDPDVINDVVSEGANYGPATCPKCGNTAIEIPSHTESSNPPGQWVSIVRDIPEAYEDFETSKYECADYACETCKYLFGKESAFSEEMIGWAYDKDGYKLQDCLTNDVFVIESPFYTYAPFCSPCVPGAGNLDDSPTLEWDSAVLASAREAGCFKIYALGHDWFEGNTAPYRVFRVEDDMEVTA